MARKWHRWQDWAALVIGVLTALTPIVVSTDTAALWSLTVFGLLIVVAGHAGFRGQRVRARGAGRPAVHLALGVQLRRHDGRGLDVLGRWRPDGGGGPGRAARGPVRAPEARRPALIHTVTHDTARRPRAGLAAAVSHVTMGR